MSRPHEVPAELTGPVAATLRWALPRLRADMGGPVPWERELRALSRELAESARAEGCPPADTNSEGPRHDGPELVSAVDAAERLGVNPRTLRRWCATGGVRGAQRLGGSWFVPTYWLDNRIDDRQGRGAA